MAPETLAAASHRFPFESVLGEEDPCGLGRPTEATDTLSSLNPLSVESLRLVCSVVPPLRDSDLFLGQPIQLVHQRIDLRIGGLDLALEELLVTGDGGGHDLVVERPIGCSRRLGGATRPKAGNLCHSYCTGAVLAQPNADGQVLEDASPHRDSTHLDRATREVEQVRHRSI